MAASFAFLGMLLLSLVVALLAALQLADFFNANEEFVLVIAGIAIFSVVAIAVFASVYSLARSARALNAAASVLALTVVLLAFVLGFLPRLVGWIADWSSNPFTVGIVNTSVTLELLIPALLTVLVQWGLVRRRWLAASGGDELTRWPWVTTVVAGLVILNPLGLAVVAAALQYSASDFMWRSMAMLTAAVALVVLVMAGIECYIRGRILRRRLATSIPPLGGEANRAG